MQKASTSSLENQPIDSLRIELVRNCILTRSQLLMTWKGVDRACWFENVPFKNFLQVNFMGAGSVVKNKLDYLEDRDDYFFVMNPWAKGYYHWLAEVAPKFFVFEKELRKGKILMPENRPGFITDFLETFGFDNIVNIKSNAFIKKLHAITNPHTGHFDLEHMSNFRERVYSSLGITTRKGLRNYYLSRRKAATRRIVNEEEVVGMLSNYGFECITTDDASLTDEVKLFSECAILISPHGAGLTNELYMPPGSSVIELFPTFKHRETEFRACFKRLCDVMGQTHSFVFCEHKVVGRKSDFRFDDIFVNTVELKNVVERLLK